METYKLKIKIGQHEFDAEGPTEAVERQFEAFKQIIAATPIPIQVPSTTVEAAGRIEAHSAITGNGATLTQPSIEVKFDAIFKLEGRLVSLTALPKSDPETGFLIVLGQKLYRTNDAVTGSEILEGVERSSGRAFDRADKLLSDYLVDGSLLKTGSRRGIRYRLSNQGFAKAQALAKELMNNVA